MEGRAVLLQQLDTAPHQATPFLDMDQLLSLDMPSHEFESFSQRENGASDNDQAPPTLKRDAGSSFDQDFDHGDYCIEDLDGLIAYFDDEAPGPSPTKRARTAEPNDSGFSVPAIGRASCREGVCQYG